MAKMNRLKPVLAATIWGIGATQVQAHPVPEFDCRMAIHILEIGKKGKQSSIDDQSMELIVPDNLLDKVVNEEDPIALAENWHSSGPLVANSAVHAINKRRNYLSCAFLLAEFRVGESTQGHQEGHIVKSITESNARFPIILLRQFESHQEARTAFETWERAKYRIHVEFGPLSKNGHGKTKATSTTFKKVVFLGDEWQSSDQKVHYVPFDPERFQSQASSVDLRGQLDEVLSREGISPRAIVLCEPDCVKFQELGTLDYITVHIEEPERVLQKVDLDIMGPDGLACVIHALNTDNNIFEPKPRCDQDSIDFIKELEARIIINQEGRNWFLKRGAARIVPKSIVVELPRGVDGAGCQPDFEYTSQSGDSVKLELKSTHDRNGKFTATIDPPMEQNAGSVSGQVIVNDPAACGGNNRDVSLKVAAKLSVQLDDNWESRGIVYLFALNAKTLSEKIGPFLDPGTQVARPLVTALGDAHDRLTADLGEQAWHLIRASFELARDPGEEPDRILELGSNELRDRFAARVKKEISDSGYLLGQIAGLQFPLRGVDLRRQIEALASRDRERSLNRLDIVLIGIVANNAEEQIPDLCNDPVYNSLSGEVGEIMGPEIVLHVFPILKLRKGQDGVIPETQPMAFSASAPSRLGGPYRCTAVAANTRIYPFVVEYWRGPEPALSRYGVALGDQLYSILGELVQ